MLKATVHRASLLLFLNLVLLLSSCSIQLNETLDGKFGGTLRLTHVGADPKTLNPWTATDAGSSHFASLLYESLLVNDPDTNEPIPHFAKEFSLSDGGKTIEVTLRDDIFWTDGVPITAYDVEYTWNTLLRDQVAESSLRDILLVDNEFPHVEAINDKQIIFRTKEIFAPFLNSIGIAIAPKHDLERFFEERGASSLEDQKKAFHSYLSINSDLSRVVSSGAFEISSIKHGERIEFRRNPNYFIKDSSGKSLPYLDRIIYSYVQDNTAAVFKFLAGEVHTLSVGPQNAAFIKTLENQYDFTLFDNGPSTGTNFLWFNLSKNVPEPKYSWFNNKNFRQAISYAIDRESVVDNVFQGLGEPLFTAESLKSPYLNTSLTKGFSRNLRRALELLEEEGFKLVNNELIDSLGNRVEFNLFTNAGNPERELIAVIIVDNLKDLGIKANFKLLEFNNFVGRLMQGKDYEAGIISLTGGTEPNGGANVWRSTGRLHMFDVKKFQEDPLTRDWEKELDRIFNQGVRVMEIEKRKEFYDRYQEIVYEYNPLIYIASPKTLSAISNKLGNVRQTKYAGPIPYLHELYLLN
jgi:peptide/nickel transport system substrate-binding protein